MKQYSKGIITTVLVLMFVGLVTATTISNTQITGFTDIIFSNGASIEEDGEGLKINNISFQNDGESINVYSDSSNYRLYGDNGSTTWETTNFDVISRNSGDDGTGASYRTTLSLWNNFGGNGTVISEERGLGISCHDAGTSQLSECSFYTPLKNTTGWWSKAFEWSTRENSTGILKFEHLNAILFPEEYTGWTGTEINEVARLLSQDPEFRIDLDFDTDSTAERFSITRNNNAETLFDIYISTGETRFSEKKLFIGTREETQDVFLYFWNPETSIYDSLFLDKFGHEGPDNSGFSFSNDLFSPTITAGDYYSGDGTQGMTGTCGSSTTLTIKDGLITACS